MERWAIEWRSFGSDGKPNRHFIGDGCNYRLFRTKREAAAWIKVEYGYIAKRPDLRGYPHFWRMPAAVKVKVMLKAMK